MRFGSLFAGIGGFDLGLERAGMECAWQVEIDAKAGDVLARHWPGVKRYQDVGEIDGRRLEPVELICGGFPCQDLSVAGRRKGLAGERSGLWFEFHRVLAEARPAWCLIENVPGLLSSSGGRDLATILSGLAELGYRSARRILDAQYFGVAQRRRRVFIVGHLGDGRAAEVLFERESSAWDSPPSREAGARVANALAQSSVSSGYRFDASEEMIAFANVSDGSSARSATDLVPPPTNRHGDPGMVAYNIQSNDGGDHKRKDRPNGGLYVSETETALTVGSTDRTVMAYGLSENQRGECLLTPYSHQLTSGGGKPGQGYGAVCAFEPGNLSRRCGSSPNSEIVSTLGAKKTGDTFPHLAGNFGVRRLTPTECERLQGFPDGWTDGQADSVRYRQLGNAVCVNVAEWIGKRIMESANG